MARWLMSLFAVCAVLGLALGARSPQGTAAPADALWGANYFPNLPVVTHDGKQLHFYDDLIKDKIVVINFIYTTCANICSLSTARLAQVRDKLGDRVGRDIFFYSITLDPVIDGPEVLKKYAGHFYNGPGWLFLTGKPDDLDQIRFKLGERSKTKYEHRNDVMLGNDVTGEWGRDSIFSDIDHLVRAILEMDPAERAKVGPVSASGQSKVVRSISDAPSGEALFIKACASCHTIGRGILVGPDLAGVMERRDPSWLKRFIMAPDKMIAEKDPIALELAGTFNGLRMPSLGLSETDIMDVMSYLELRTRVTQSNAGAEKSATGDSHAPAETAR